MFKHYVVELTNKKLVLTVDIEDVICKTVTPIVNGAHVTCPKYLGMTVYLVICKE
jgi:putative transposon-encoded protein